MNWIFEKEKFLNSPLEANFMATAGGKVGLFAEKIG